MARDQTYLTVGGYPFGHLSLAYRFTVCPARSPPGKTINPSYGIILWIILGALAGWIGSKIMGTDARQGAIANVVVGIVGAVVGGYGARVLFGNNAGTNSLLGSFLVALVGACVVIFIWKLISGRRR